MHTDFLHSRPAASTIVKRLILNASVCYHHLSYYTSQIAYYQLLALPMQMKLCGNYRITHFENDIQNKTSSRALEEKHFKSGLL
jgi:hypothetical protein